MRRILMGVLAIAAAVPVALPADESEATGLRRLYDMTPGSPANPTLLRVREYGIEISLSEFQAYIKSLPTDAFKPGPTAKPSVLTPVEKRKHLDRLLDEHLLMWEGYRRKADQAEGMVLMLKNTQAMLLQEALIQQEVVDKAKTREEYARLSQQLLDRLFERVKIDVSNEAYTRLKAAIEIAAEKEGVPSTGDTLPTSTEKQYPLARTETFALTMEEALEAYLRIPADRRPDLRTEEGLSALLKVMLGEYLLVTEARARGLDKSPKVTSLLQLNRNALVRMDTLDRLTETAVGRMKAPDLEVRLEKWHEANLSTRYTRKQADGKDEIVSFAAERETIQNDYFDALNERLRAELLMELRKGKPVEIDDKLLSAAVVRAPSAIPPQLESSVIAWNADTQEYQMKGDEPSTAFSFVLTNVTTEPVTIFRAEPSCACTTVQMPATPWILLPGERGELRATMDIRGKSARYLRTIEVESSHGPKTLTLKIIAPGKQARESASLAPGH